jgi:Skp family chaperone for outer membrane proteins
MVTLSAKDGAVVARTDDTAIAAAAIGLFIAFSINFRGTNAAVTKWFHAIFAVARLAATASHRKKRQARLGYPRAARRQADE